MLATTIDTLDLPLNWYLAVEQIQLESKTVPYSAYQSHGVCFGYINGTSATNVHTLMANRAISITQLGWSPIDALETHLKLRHFAEDWDAPGMEAYDEL
jgi:hypothetical protein